MGGNLTMQVGLLVVFIAAMYFLLIRPQKKKEKQVADMRNSLQPGDEIITIGGIYGKVVKVKDDSIVIAVGADKVKFEMTKWSISSVVNKSTSRAAAPAEEEPTKKRPKKLKKEAAVEEAEAVVAEVATETEVAGEAVAEAPVEEAGQAAAEEVATEE